MYFSRRSFIRNTAMISGLALPVSFTKSIPPGDAIENSTNNNDDYNSGDEFGEAEKLIKAVKSGSDKLVKKILEKSPSLIYLRDEKDRSLTWMASMHGQIQLIQILQPKDYTADIFDFCATGDIKAVNDYVKKNPLSLNNSNKAGYAPLLASSEWGQGASVETLVGIGANL
jgi:hypothetical protein